MVYPVLAGFAGFGGAAAEEVGALILISCPWDYYRII
jgi:hypothetical protein